MPSSTAIVPSPVPCPARRRVRGPVPRLVRARVLQVALLIGFWQAGDWIARRSGIPVPGPVLGLFLVLLALGSGWLPPARVAHGARWLLGEMLLFFMPPTLALLDHARFFGLLGLKLLVAIVAGTVVVMTVTALAIEACHRLAGPREGP